MIANETTINKRQNDTDINNYRAPSCTCKNVDEV